MKNLTLISILFLAISFQTTKDMNEHQRKMVENYVSSYNDFDIAGMTKNLTENVVFENISHGNVELRTEGLVEFKKQAESTKKYFTNRNQTT